MRNLEKYYERDADDSSSINSLPDEIVLYILSKLIDLKTLCCCYLVSRRVSSIVLQVDTISFTTPFLNPPVADSNTFRSVDSDGFSKKLFRLFVKPLYLLRQMIFAPSRPLPPIISSFDGGSYRSTVTFLCKFRGLKSLCIELPSISFKGTDKRCFFKWKVKFGNTIQSILFLSPTIIVDPDGKVDVEDLDYLHDPCMVKLYMAASCRNEVVARHRLLLYIIKDVPMLEEISITDSGRRGTLSLSGKKLSEVKEWVNSVSETVMDHVEVPDILSDCYIRFLKLPVSGYMMKEIYFTLVEMKNLEGGYDFLMESENGFEDKEEVAYTEAMMEILEKHKASMERFL